jgi:fatty-acid desaturase
MSLTWMAVITFVILQMSVFATTIYLQRSITHRGLQLHPIVAVLMHLELLLFTGIIPRQWAAVHRKHHHHSDEAGDPHSPRVLGMWTVLFGNYFLYKKQANNPATVRKYTPDYRPDVIEPPTNVYPKLQHPCRTRHFHADVWLGVGSSGMGRADGCVRIAELVHQQLVPHDRIPEF